MAKNASKSITDQFASDLRILSQVLSRQQVSVSGPRSIETASYHLIRDEDGKKVISFVVSDIDIKVDTSRHMMPGSVSMEDRLLADIIFKQDVTGQNKDEETLKRIIGNEVRFRIRGRKGGRELVSAWHFDRHAQAPNPNSPAHPTYHFQFGGWGLKNIADKIDGIIILDTPRYFAPPMDPILAVDFLLSHFNGPRWHTIRSNEARYIDIVRRAQARLWKPYFDNILEDLSPAPGGAPARLFGLLPNVL